MMVSVDDSSLQYRWTRVPRWLTWFDVWRWTAAWPCPTFIRWTGWTLELSQWLSWWQYDKHCLEYYYYDDYLFTLRNENNLLCA